MGGKRPPTRKFKAVALDLDGTLLSSKHTLSDETRECLVRLHDTGVHIIIATGRTLSECLEFTPILPPAVTFAASNGAHVAHWRDGESTTKLKRALAPSVAMEVVQILRERNITFCLFIDGNAYVNDPEHVTLFCADATQRTYCPDFTVHAHSQDITSLMIPVHFQPHLVASRFDPPSAARKALLAEASDSILKVLEPFDFPRLGIKLLQSSTSSGHGSYIDLVSAEAGKARALEVLCDHLDISMHEIVSFGDSGNDLCMLRGTGWSVVPANGTTTAKQAAKTTSRWSNDEDCVRRELQQLFRL